jgi:very-short-patch-repair endonuclease
MPRRKRATEADERGQVLVAIMNNQRDFTLLQNELWYRIPVASRPRRWPPQWLAFYQTKVFGDEAFAVNYYGRVREIQVAKRYELFPSEPANPKSEREYYKVCLHSLEPREQPIRSTRWRRLVFIPTTWLKFVRAVEINDLFDDSPLEDDLWAELRQRKIDAERQWDVQVSNARYQLDFALFCAQGHVDVETDGDTWHASRERIPLDNSRDNALTSAGWHVLRFNGHQIRESLADECLPQITTTITRLGGLSSEGLAPRVFYNTPAGSVEQLSLFEADTEYDLD